MSTVCLACIVFLYSLMERTREAIEAGRFAEFRRDTVARYLAR